MSKFGLFSSAARSAISALGIQPGDEGEQPAPIPAPTPSPAPAPSEDPAGDPPADPAPAAASAAPVVADIVTPAQAADERAAAAEAGAAAERTRVAAVFASPEAIANPATAAWMIVNAPNASAEAIVSHMKNHPSVAAPAAPAASIAPTNVAVGTGAPAADSGASGGDGDESMAVWGEVQAAQATANAPIVVARAAAGLNGATTVTASLPRTGN